MWRGMLVYCTFDFPEIYEQEKITCIAHVLLSLVSTLAADILTYRVHELVMTTRRATSVFRPVHFSFPLYTNV